MARKLQWCILIYSILLCFIMFVVFTFKTKVKYFGIEFR